MPIEETSLGTWDSLHREHLEIFTKVNLLESALIDFLQKRTAGPVAVNSDLQRDFLEAFKHGITLHFAVEEAALFPAMRKMGKTAATLVDELLVEHRSIMEKYGKTVHAADAEEKRGILLQLIQELAAHTQKEEKFVSPIVAQMSLGQQREVDQTAKRLGYVV